MNSATFPTFKAANADTRGANRAITWSVAVHVGLVLAAFLLPREWFAKKPAPPVMTISLGGTPGPKSTGTTSIGSKTIEQVAPQPKRPEPIPATPKAVPVAPMPVRTPPRTTVEDKPSPVPKPPPMPPTRAPVTGPQVNAGNTAADTGARGQGAGLSFGGTQGMGGETDLQGFCCPEYLGQIQTIIESGWQKNQPERGKAILKFTIQKDGRITDIIVEQSSGLGVLDRASRNALSDARLPRLPPGYTRETLTIHLTFPYGSQ